MVKAGVAKAEVVGVSVVTAGVEERAVGEA